MGAPKGNLNRLTTGRHSRQLRIVLGELPKPMERVTRTIRKYRRHLETTVEDVHGEISDSHAHLIDEAATCEQTVGVSRWLLRTKLDSMTVPDVLACLREIRQAKGQRNRAVRLLEIDAQFDPWSTIHAGRWDTVDTDESEANESAPCDSADSSDSTAGV